MVDRGHSKGHEGQQAVDRRLIALRDVLILIGQDLFDGGWAGLSEGNAAQREAVREFFIRQCKIRQLCPQVDIGQGFRELSEAEAAHPSFNIKLPPSPIRLVCGGRRPRLYEASVFNTELRLVLTKRSAAMLDVKEWLRREFQKPDANRLRKSDFLLLAKEAYPHLPDTTLALTWKTLTANEFKHFAAPGRRRKSP